jgi:hypothetical protein
VRQEDPEERFALSELRAGEVDVAVAWYADQGRIVASHSRHEALDATVAAWAADVEAGTDSAMLAWRRANVAELNARAVRPWPPRATWARLRSWWGIATTPAETGS